MHPGAIEIWRQPDVHDRGSLLYDRLVEADFAHDLETVAFHRNLSTINTDRLMSFIVQDRRYLNHEGRSLLHVMRERPVTTFQHFEIGKQHPLEARLNGLLLRVAAGGLLDMWYATVYAREVASGRLADAGAVGSDPHAAPAPIALPHVQAAFMLLGAGTAISWLVFVLECARIRAWGRRPREVLPRVVTVEW